MTKNLDTNGNHLPHSVGVVYSDVKREYFPTEAQYLTEKQAKADAQVIASCLQKMGIVAHLFPANSDLPQALKKTRPDMVLNLTGSVKGNESLASTVPALMELLDLPYTGAGILGESLSYNKFLVKKLMEQHGLPVPHYQLFNHYTDPLSPSLRFPLISKLNEIHGAVEITRDAVSDTPRHLQDRVKYLIATYEQPVLVEEFIVGREITAFLLEGMKKKVYLAEKIFKNTGEKYIFANFEDQWLSKDPEIITYQKYTDPILEAYVRQAFKIMRMADLGKFDVRLDSSGRYFFIDSNSNPYLAPKEMDCPLANILELFYGITFSEILRRLLQNTMAASSA